MDSAIGRDNFFRSPFDNQGPFWQNHLDPFAQMGLNRSPRGSPSMQRRAQPNIHDVRRSTSPQPGGRRTPTLESQMNRLHTHDSPRQFVEGGSPGQQYVHSSNPRGNENFARHHHQAPEDGRRIPTDEQHAHPYLPQRDYPTSEGERVINIPIRVEGRDSVYTLNSYGEPIQSSQNHSHVPPQTMPKPVRNQAPTQEPPSQERPVHGHQQEQHPWRDTVPDSHQRLRKPQEPRDDREEQEEGNQGVCPQQDDSRQRENQEPDAPRQKRQPCRGEEETAAHSRPENGTSDPQHPREGDPKPAEDPPQVSRIRSILAKILDVGQEIEDFTGRRGTKEYLRMEEMLVRHVLELDNVDTLGDERIRGDRRMAVITAQTLLSRLEKKALPADI